MDFRSWLESQGNFRCILVELDYKEAGVTKTAYLSNAAFVSTGTDVPAHTAYDPFVTGEVQFERSLNEVFTGFSTSKTSDIELIYNTATQALLSKAVYGQPVRIYLGDKSWPKADFKQIIAGLCDGVMPEQTKIRLKFRDAADSLKTPLLTERYASGAATEQLKPLCLGRCFNIQPLLIDSATHKYQFSTGQSQAVTAVRFNGSVVPGSYYTVNLADSTITFTTFPNGDITMDVDGLKIGGTWLQNASDFIGHIASMRGITVNCSGLASYLLGLYLTTDIATDQVMDDICASIGGYWFFDRLGQFKVRAFNGVPSEPPSAFLTKDQTVFGTNKIRRVINPLHSMTFGYKRNWTPLNTIAAVVHETAPAVAAELSAEGKAITRNQPTVLVNYPQAETIRVDSLLVSEADALTELNRRLALSVAPRFVYELQQLSVPFLWQIGECAFLESAGINGDRAVITKLLESPNKGTCTVEYWQ
ncbi:hypothetical protein [uncultured Rheinheimera sp.]|uniref:hypothetical protein n=1 Tax=uncultured Rheinheimera sp. TaxID=400532 RepID=UPI0025969251|nr:hypothetical protein [uncultured Rheinheimera sp.]